MFKGFLVPVLWIVVGAGITGIVTKYVEKAPVLIYEVQPPVTVAVPVVQPNGELAIPDAGIPLSIVKIDVKNVGGAPATNVVATLILDDKVTTDTHFLDPGATWMARLRQQPNNTGPTASITASAGTTEIEVPVGAIPPGTPMKTNIHMSLGGVFDVGKMAESKATLAGLETGWFWDHKSIAPVSTKPIIVKLKRFLQGDAGTFVFTWLGSPPNQIKSLRLESDQGLGGDAKALTVTVGTYVLYREYVLIAAVAVLALLCIYFASGGKTVDVTPPSAPA